MRMKVRRHGIFYQLYKFGRNPPFLTLKPKDDRGRTSPDQYLRALTLGAAFHASIVLVTVVLSVLCSIVLNVITILSGFGISILYPNKKFLAIPFEFKWRETWWSWSRVLVPFWLLVGNLGLVLTTNPIPKTHLITVVLMNGSVAVGYLLSIRFAKKSSQQMNVVEFIN